MKENYISVYATQGMQIRDVGSFDRKDEALVNGAIKPVDKKVIPHKKMPEVVRVKPKAE